MEVNLGLHVTSNMATASFPLLNPVNPKQKDNKNALKCLKNFQHVLDEKHQTKKNETNHKTRAGELSSKGHV